MQTTINQLPHPVPEIARLLGEEEPEITPCLDGGLIANFKSFFFVYEAQRKIEGKSCTLASRGAKEKPNSLKLQATPIWW